jgi:hypothetical protein
MGASQFNSLPAIGFLSVVEIPDRGLVGGYLVVTSGARPIEFHCTTPVRANRAQEILYGPTLGPYLYGEQIGQTLLARPRSQPILALTDVEGVLAARHFTSLPVVYVLPPDPESEPAAGMQHADPREASERGEEAAPASDCGRAHPPCSWDRPIPFGLGPYRLGVHRAFPEDQQVATHCWSGSIGGMDLHEPFERIHEAIHEAQGGGVCTAAGAR